MPAADVVEQASSTVTARYKATLVKGSSFADLCAGAGVDSWTFAENFKTGLCIDADPDTAAALAHNLKILGHSHVQVIHDKAENFIGDMPSTDLVYLDPQRRSNAKKGRFRFEDCQPDILQLLPALKEKAKTIMLKASPMLDIDEGIRIIGDVQAVHILEWRSDCKELVFIIRPGYQAIADQIPITAVGLSDTAAENIKLTFTRSEESEVQIEYAPPQTYLYEPGPAFQKSGGFKALAQRYDVKKLHPHTHLYTSDALRPDFPGRVFEIKDVFPARAKALPFRKANLSVRNFPETVQNLRKKLKLQDGGEDYLFACTLMEQRKVLIHGRKINPAP